MAARAANHGALRGDPPVGHLEAGLAASTRNDHFRDLPRRAETEPLVSTIRVGPEKPPLEGAG